MQKYKLLTRTHDNLYARVNSTIRADMTIRFIHARALYVHRAMTRACGRADRMVIYVPVHAMHALRRALRHAQFAYTEGDVA